MQNPYSQEFYEEPEEQKMHLRDYLQVIRKRQMVVLIALGLVFFATVIVLFVFLRFFSMILLRFVAEQVLQNRPPVTEEERKATSETVRKEVPASASRKPQAAS